MKSLPLALICVYLEGKEQKVSVDHTVSHLCAIVRASREPEKKVGYICVVSFFLCARAGVGRGVFGRERSACGPLPQVLATVLMTMIIIVVATDGNNPGYPPQLTIAVPLARAVCGRRRQDRQGVSSTDTPGSCVPAAKQQLAANKQQQQSSECGGLNGLRHFYPTPG